MLDYTSKRLDKLLNKVRPDDPGTKSPVLLLWTDMHENVNFSMNRK